MEFENELEYQKYAAKKLIDDGLIELPKGDKGDPGKDGKDGSNYVLTSKDKVEIAKSIKVPVVEKVIEKVEVIREQPIVTQNTEVIELAVTDEPIVIAEKLNTLDEKVEPKVLKGWKDLNRIIRENNAKLYTGVSETRVRELIQQNPGGTTSPLTTKGDIFGYSTTNDRIPVGTDGKVLTADSTNSLGVSWQTPTTTSPGGSDTQVQFNDSGTFGGDAGFTYNKTTDALTLTNLVVTPTSTATSYTNVGGSGNRKALITVTTTITSLNLTPDYLVNGNTTESNFYWGAQTTAGKYLRFDFGSGNKFVINEAKWYQDLTSSQGVWQWQGSNDASSWTNIGSTFTLGGSATQTQTELSSNTTAYRYYQLLGVSGSLSGAPYDREMEFKISTAITGTTADVTGRLYLQSNGNPLEIGGMTVFNSGVIYNSRPLISSQWNTSGSSIYYPVTGDSGDVGFGRVPTSGYRVDIEKIGRVVSSTSNQPAEFYWANSSGNSFRIGQDAGTSPVLGTANAGYISLAGATAGLIIYDSSTERFRLQKDGLFGIGSGSNTVTKLHVIGTDTTNGQWRFGYDASNYLKGVISSTGGVTFDAVGSGAGFTFSDPVTATQLTSSGLTAGRVTFAGTAGILVDDADMTFSGSRLTVTDLTSTNAPIVSSLTAGRVVFAGGSKELVDDADFTFATDTLTVTKIVGTTSIKVGTAAGYISSDGSTGATGSFTSADLKTVTVKDGIITSIV